MSEVFATVMSGLILYILSQCFVEFVVNHIKEYKSLRQRIIYIIKMYCCYYNNPYNAQDKTKNVRTKEEYDLASMEIRKIGAELASYIGNVYRKKERKKLKEVLDALIGISNGFYKTNEYNPINDNKQCESVIMKNLKFE